MSLFTGMKDKAKRVKGMEWALLLVVLGLAGSLLLSPNAGSLLGGATPSPTASVQETLEARLSRVLSSMEGAGKVEVVIHYREAAVPASSWLDGTSTAQAAREPVGVVVVAEGADDLEVRLLISRAVETLLGLPADAVDVFKMSGAMKGE